MRRFRWAATLLAAVVVGGCAARAPETCAVPVLPAEPRATYSAIQVTFPPVTAAAPAKAEVGQPAPNWTLPSVDGQPVSLADYRGKKGVLLVFFATWCPHCMKEVPDLIAFQNKYKGRNVEVVGVAVDQNAPVIRRFAEQHKTNYTLVLDEGGKVAGTFGVIGVPTNVGIDAAGVVRYLDNPLPHDLDKLAKQLEPKKP